MSSWSRRHTIRAIAAASLGSIAGCSSLSKQIRTRTRWSADRVEWAAPLNGSPLALTLSETQLFAGNHWGIYAFDPLSGEQQWYTELDSPDDTVSYPGLVDTDGTTVYTASFSELLAFDAADGSRRWSTRITGGEPTLRVAAGRVYVSDSTVQAVDAQRGETLWTSQETSTQYTRGVVVDGTVYVGSRDGTVSALDAEDGHERWRVSLGPVRIAEPIVVDGTVYIGGSTSSNGTLAALDATDGSVQWRVSTASVGLDQAPAVSEDALFVGCFGDEQGRLVAHERTDGTRRWSYTPPESWLVGQPVTTDGVVYAGAANGTVYAVDVLSGKPVWEFDVGGIAYTKPVIGNSVLYVAGDAHVASLKTGSVQ